MVRVFFFFILCSYQINAQSTLLGSIQYGITIPVDELSVKESGQNVGFGLIYEFENLWGGYIESNFMFGSLSNDEIISPYLDADGILYGNDGLRSNYSFKQEGLNISLGVQKTHFFNESIFTTIGVSGGYIQRKTELQTDVLLPKLITDAIDDGEIKGFLTTQKLSIGWQNQYKNFLLSLGVKNHIGITKRTRVFENEDENKNLFFVMPYLEWRFPLYKFINADEIQY